MAEILPRHFYFAAILFTIVIVGVVYILNDIQAGDPGDPSTSATLMSDTDLHTFNNTFNKQQNLTNNIESLQSNMQHLSVDNLQSAITLPIALIQTAWGMVKFVFSSFSFMNSAIEGLSGYIGIPPIITTLTILIIVSIFVFSALSVALGKDL